MVRFLLDANLSPETANYLKNLGYEAITVAQLHLEKADDETVVRYATERGYVLISFDLDFGYLFRFLFPHEVGIVILRLENQTIESANAALLRLHNAKVFDNPEHYKTLMVVDENTIRIRK